MAAADERKRLLLLAALLWGCVPSVPPAPARYDGPSDYDFLAAMEAAAPQRAIADGEECRPVRQLQCVPARDDETFRCTYRYGRDLAGIAVLERERHGFWRWTSGPRNCTGRAL